LVEDQYYFNLLLQNFDMEDLSLLGRKFTWVQPNGACSSRLDRILVFGYGGFIFIREEIHMGATKWGML
jgi:hypothetical protein